MNCWLDAFAAHGRTVPVEEISHKKYGEQEFFTVQYLQK